MSKYTPQHFPDPGPDITPPGSGYPLGTFRQVSPGRILVSGTCDGLPVSRRFTASLFGPDPVAGMIAVHQRYLSGENLARICRDLKVDHQTVNALCHMLGPKRPHGGWQASRTVRHWKQVGHRVRASHRAPQQKNNQFLKGMENAINSRISQKT